MHLTNDFVSVFCASSIHFDRLPFLLPFRCWQETHSSCQCFQIEVLMMLLVHAYSRSRRGEDYRARLLLQIAGRPRWMDTVVTAYGPLLIYSHDPTGMN